MDSLVNPQVYTIITFGASIFLWLFLPTVTITSSMGGMPLYLIHPFFTLELFLMLSTAIVWAREMLISFYNLRKQRVALTKSMVQNLFVSLAFVTLIVAISGCIVFSQTVHFEESGDLVDWIIIPFNPFKLLYFYGILFCEGTLIIMGLARALKRL